MRRVATPDKTETAELPAVYSPEHIAGELEFWRVKLKAAREGSGQVSEKACLAWLDKWLDESLDRRGR